MRLPVVIFSVDAGLNKALASQTEVAILISEDGKLLRPWVNHT